MSPADSIFDPATFMPETTEQGSTASPIVDPGEYPGMIDKAEWKVITSKKDGKQYPMLEVTYKLQAPEFEKSFSRPPTVRQGIFVDMLGSNLDMAKGKNTSLNKIREALGQNKAGQKWNHTMLVGAGPVKVMVFHEADRNSPDVMRAQVRSVGKM